MGLTDFSTGVQGGLQALIAQRIKEKMLADSLKQQEFQNARQTQGDARAQQQLDATIEGNTFNRERQVRIDDSLMQDRLAGQAKDAADTIPSETWMQGGDPAATTMQKGGYGALLTPTKPTQAMGPAFEGPMGDGETPQQAQVGRSGGFLKTASQAQMKEMAAQRDKQMDNDRQTGAATETARHNGAMERNAAAAAAAAGSGRELANQMKELDLQMKEAKFAATQADTQKAKDSAASQTSTALDLVKQLREHPGFGAAYGNISSRLSGFSQSAQDAGAIRDQLVAALTLPNLGSLKGPMSDKDVVFVKALSTRLGNPRISEQEAAQALHEAEIRLRGGATPTGMVQMMAPDGRALAVPADKVAEMESHGAKRK